MTTVIRALATAVILCAVAYATFVVVLTRVTTRTHDCPCIDPIDKPEEG